MDKKRELSLFYWISESIRKRTLQLSRLCMGKIYLGLARGRGSVQSTRSPHGLNHAPNRSSCDISARAERPSGRRTRNSVGAIILTFVKRQIDSP